MRTKMPNRREGYTEPLTFREGQQGEIKTFITCNFNDDGVITEVFAADPRIGSDIQALLTDGCILISLNLQSGADLERLSKSLGEDRPEGAKTGPPSSLLGAVVQAILRVQQDYNNMVVEDAKTL